MKSSYPRTIPTHSRRTTNGRWVEINSQQQSSLIPELKLKGAEREYLVERERYSRGERYRERVTGFEREMPREI